MSLKHTLQAIELTNILALNPSDQEQIRAIRNEPEVRRNMYTDHLISADEHASWLTALGGTSTRERTSFFAAVFDNQVVGGVSLSGIDRTNKRADWAFYLSASTQGKGIGSVLEFKLLELAFGQHQLNKLNCEVLDFNEPVIRLHGKFGFIEEGRRRAQVNRNGTWHVAVLLGMLRDEWLARRDTISKRLFKDG